LAQKFCQTLYARFTAWWALVDRSRAFMDGRGIRLAIREAATRALRLWQQGQDALAVAHFALETALRLPTGLATALMRFLDFEAAFNWFFWMKLFTAG
jgi:hypothetical protein